MQLPYFWLPICLFTQLLIAESLARFLLPQHSIESIDEKADGEIGLQVPQRLR